MPERREVVFRVHAIERMFQRGIGVYHVKRILDEGEEVESYPEDRPHPSRLLLAFIGGRPLHVVAADDAESNQTFVITVYEPTLDLWEPEFRRRRRRL